MFKIALAFSSHSCILPELRASQEILAGDRYNVFFLLFFKGDSFITLGGVHFLSTGMRAGQHKTACMKDKMVMQTDLG